MLRGISPVPHPDPKPNPIMQKQQAQIKIRQVPAQEKPKPSKKQAPTHEELTQNTENLLKSYLESSDMKHAISAAKDMRPPNKYQPEMVSYFILTAVDRADIDRENVSRLITELKAEGVVSSLAFIEVL